MNSIGIVGCGALGRGVLTAVAQRKLNVPVAGVTSRTAETAQAFLAGLPDPPPYLELDELIARADLIVETAGGHVVAELARRTFAAGKDLLVISMGALLDHPDLIDLAREKNCRLILPSGAIAGLDAIKGASEGEIDHVTITTRKPLRSLEGAPLASLTEETELYSGPVRAAVKGFPASVNIAACVAMAGIGPDKTTIRISAVPGLKRNTHTVDVEGEFGSLTLTIANAVSENPRTGRLTSMSIVRTIRDLTDPFRIGT
jgi:aspartate dehydrogenase